MKLEKLKVLLQEDFNRKMDIIATMQDCGVQSVAGEALSKRFGLNDPGEEMPSLKKERRQKQRTNLPVGSVQSALNEYLKTVDSTMQFTTKDAYDWILNKFPHLSTLNKTTIGARLCEIRNTGALKVVSFKRVSPRDVRGSNVYARSTYEDRQ